MAEVKSTPNELLERFEWGRESVRGQDVTVPGDAYAHLASNAIDVGSGIQSVLSLLESNDIAEGDESVTPLVSKADMFSLLRLAKYAAQELAKNGEESLNWAYRYHTEEGRKEYARS
jgi:hypothetical protein